MTAPAFAVALVAALLAAAPLAHADQAGSLRQQGLKAEHDHDWEIARERFEQSYALDPRPVTLFHLAVAQEHTERLVEARESYALFLEQPVTRETWALPERARAAIAALDLAVPILHIRATGQAAGDVVEVDGRALNSGDVPLSLGLPIPLDPGAHTVVVRRGRDALVERALTVARGARDDVELAVPVPAPVVPPPVPPSVPPPPRVTFERAPSPAHPGVLRSGWFWGATIAVLAVAGASYYYLSVPTRDPTRGTLDPGVITVP